jgi:hypothetical protein
LGRTIAVVMGLAVSLLLAEVAVRLLGHHPRPAASEGEGPTLRHDTDPALGWVPRPGTYRYRPGGEDQPEILVRVWSDRSRATSETEPEGSAEIVTLGGSFTFGQDVSDDETWPWKVQTAFPNVHVTNLGGNAYGTLQSLIRLENHLAREPTAPRVVIYGLFDHHRARNVAGWGWQTHLENRNTRGAANIPYATLDAEGRLVRADEPAIWPRLPLRTRLALVPLVERGLVRWRSRDRQGTAGPVTIALLREMAATTRRAGGRLLVAGIWWNPKERDAYTRILKASGIASVDCADRRLDSPAWRTHGETGHPNGIAHAHWARCIAKRLRPMLYPGRAP